MTRFALLTVDGTNTDRQERHRIQQNFVDGGGVRLLIIDTVTKPAPYGASGPELEDSALLTIEDLVANIDYVKADMTAKSAQLISQCGG